MSSPPKSISKSNKRKLEEDAIPPSPPPSPPSISKADKLKNKINTLNSTVQKLQQSINESTKEMKEMFQMLTTLQKESQIQYEYRNKSNLMFGRLITMNEKTVEDLNHLKKHNTSEKLLINGMIPPICLQPKQQQQETTSSNNEQFHQRTNSLDFSYLFSDSDLTPSPDQICGFSFEMPPEAILE